uniref:Uncharacterized protein n=1 Tax=Tanacetum cinerariifolium TaxID=118510 RepID=A0A6L2JMK1_TANCI|nr:hypothetical protein [Tanacetum cinerariifolium]
MPSDIEEDDDYSERDILILEELLDNYSLSLPENESFHFDIPSFSRPPAKPPDGNTGILNIKMMGDNSEQKRSAKCPMMIHGKNIPILDVPLFHFYPPLSVQVKDKQEKDKIGTKPNKNEKRGKARQCQSPVTIKKAEKEKKIQTKGTKNGNPKVV